MKIFPSFVYKFLKTKLINDVFPAPERPESPIFSPDLIAKFKALKDYDFADLKLLRNCQESVGANNINLDTIIRNVTTKRDLDTTIPLTLTFNFSEAKKNTEEIR